MAADWLAAGRTEVAAEKILDAAGQLFSAAHAATVGMNEIAAAAGCSRATLYRYFENRDALHTAYVHREAQRLFAELTGEIAAVDDPAQRVTEGILAALASVRRNPALSSWFTAAERPIGGAVADRSAVIQVLAEAFARSLGTHEPATARRQARWLVRVITSLLLFPAGDEAAERDLLTEFVVPVITPTAQATQ